MKNKFLVAFIILLCGFILVACGNDGTTPTKNSDTNPTTDKKEDEIRTTITEDEWNKTLQMSNYTLTWVMPEFTQVNLITEDAIKTSTLDSDYLSFCVNENGYFYGLQIVSGVWCKLPNVAGDSSYSTFAKYFNVQSKFSELKYDKENKTYIEHVIQGTEEFDCAYSFENGVLVQVKFSSPDMDFDVFYYITDIGTTVVEVPEYIPLSCYYALQVMPNGGGFEKVDISSYSLPSSIKEAHKAINGGYVFIVEFSGFSSGNVAVIGVDGNGKITGTKSITIRDSYEHIFNDFDSNGHFIGATFDTIDGVDTVAGSTVSSRSYREAVKDALETAKILDAAK